MREIRVRRLERSGEVEMNVPVARVGTNTQDQRGRGGWKKETFKGWRGNDAQFRSMVFDKQPCIILAFCTPRKYSP